MIDAKKFLPIRKFILLVFHVILILSFGCGPAPTPILIDLSTPTGIASPTQPPTAQVEATTSSASTVTEAPSAPGTVIKIFSHAPLSGDKATVGQDILHGVELAIQRLSAPFGELGYSLELVPYDDQNTTQVALVNAREIAADPQILCGVGHFDDNITIAASDIYHQAGLALIAPSTIATLLTDRNYLEVNRVIGHIDGQGAAAAQFAQAQGYKTVYIVSLRSETNVRNAEFFRTESARFGIKRVGSSITDLTAENIDKIVSQIMNVQPELIYISSSAGLAIPLLTKLRALGYTGTFLGTEKFQSRSAFTAADASLVEGGGLYFTATNAPATYYPGAAQFVQDFSAKYSASPHEFAARAYDAAGICLKAIEEATKVKGGTLPTRAEVARAIRRISNYQGITGTYNFNSQGDPNPAQYYVYQVKSLDPANWDQNPIVAAFEVNPP